MSPRQSRTCVRITHMAWCCGTRWAPRYRRRAPFFRLGHPDAVDFRHHLVGRLLLGEN